MCFSVEKGGLGFRSFEDMSRAFACKLWWRLRQQDSMWAEFMLHKVSSSALGLLSSTHCFMEVFGRDSAIGGEEYLMVIGRRIHGFLEE